MLNVVFLTIALSSPLIFAAMGGLTSERGGVINIGLEGLMLVSACVTAFVGVASGPWVGLASGLAAATLLSLLHWLVTQHYRIDHVISGMAVNALAAGATSFLVVKFPDRMQDVPHLPQSGYKLVAYGLPIAIWLYLRFTRGGLWLQAVGSDPDKARLAGLSPVRVRLVGLIATGVFTGLGGAMLVSDTAVFTDNMTSGRGYIALAALILGGWRPLPALGACVAFGFFSALRLQFQGQTLLGVQPPSELWASLPYLATVVALAGFLGRNRTPLGLGKL